MKNKGYIIFIFNDNCKYSGYIGGYITEWYNDDVAAVVIRKNYSNWKDIEGKLRLFNTKVSGDYLIFESMEEYNNKMEELKKFHTCE
jgi:hypothetical protein